nr:MAG TPA: hypothetical protein [Caudoviricetes sp.]
MLYIHQTLNKQYHQVIFFAHFHNRQEYAMIF